MGRNDLDWLLDHAMLEGGAKVRSRVSGHGEQWQRPYAESRPRAASSVASVWFAAYPGSIITKHGRSVLATLADPALWATFADIGIQAVHTGPTKRAGGLNGREYTPSVDGHFDRISLEIDPAFGTVEEFQTMSANARAVGAGVIDDIIPGHTGKGADFRLAELGYGDYPGIYHMVEVQPQDWEILPPVPSGKDSVNLSPAAVDRLKALGYIVGPLQRTIFYEPGVKETDWSATSAVTGVDGRVRRWVYLHYFKDGQPTLNWLDPSFAGPRLIMGDALHSLSVLGASMLRLDANGFLGIEPRTEGRAWSEGHPLSVTANQIIAGMVRKVGGFTFQELNLTVDDIAAMTKGGADLSYDFITRPAYHTALASGDTEFLRLMLATMVEYGIDSAALIHALQNHDELTLELVHFWTLHRNDSYAYHGATVTGTQLRDEIRQILYSGLTGSAAPYNLAFSNQGIACTTASVVAASLGFTDLDALGPGDIGAIRDAHLLLVLYNAFQPGVFCLSGWDLVGALPLPPNAVQERMEDGDTRWINRGAYDLMGINPAAEHSASGLPRARALYGSLPDQLNDPDSFASRLKHLLAIRKAFRLHEARLLSVPIPANPGLLVMVHTLPDGLGTEVTALNFSGHSVSETMILEGVDGSSCQELIGGGSPGVYEPRVGLEIRLEARQGKAFLLK